MAVSQIANLPNSGATSEISEVLSYNGSKLGKFNFLDVIIWAYPCTSKYSRTITLYALLKLNNHEYPVILKRNCTRKNDQILADELKPLFGLIKIGSHEIRLKGIPKKINEKLPWIQENGQINMYLHPQWSNYFVFRAFTHNLDGKLSFIPMTPLQEVEWCPSSSSAIKNGHRKFFYELQKIWVFRDLFHISNTNMRNILVRHNPYNPHEKIVPISINETTIRSSDYTTTNSRKVERFFFPKSTTKSEIMIRMLGLEPNQYQAQLEDLKWSISQIINRVNPEQIHLANDIINYIFDQVSVYFNLISNH